MSRRIERTLLRIAASPEPMRLAKALSGHLAGRHRFRVGDYRAHFIRERSTDAITLYILHVEHRSNVYRDT